MDETSILESFVSAVIELLNDDDLVRANPAELSVTTELAMKMVKYFPDHRVSPEWTRREEAEKRIAWDDEEGRRRIKEFSPTSLFIPPIAKTRTSWWSKPSG